ncbi:MAG: fibronectin type III domain-containing protein, partial [Duncaniella sp.]|nr:fibronectin type III domain-containing protein [Duncaniella sp.]
LESYVFTITEAYPYLKNPTSLKAAKIEKSAITLSWADNSDNETGFEIEISKNGTSFTKVGEVAANVTTYTADNLD